jgi:ubiquinone/menaquinone biosynthesis C-methylase UbiE
VWTGAVTRRIASRVFPAETFGIDIDPVFIGKAKKTALDGGAKNIRFELGNIDSLVYDDGFFDLTYCRLVLMHVRNPVKTVAELKRVTKEGGIVASSDNDDGAILIYPPVPRFLSLWQKALFSFLGSRLKIHSDTSSPNSCHPTGLGYVEDARPCFS